MYIRKKKCLKSSRSLEIQYIQSCILFREKSPPYSLLPYTIGVSEELELGCFCRRPGFCWQSIVEASKEEQGRQNQGCRGGQKTPQILSGKKLKPLSLKRPWITSCTLRFINLLRGQKKWLDQGRTAVEEVLIIQKNFAKFFGPRMFIRS